MYKIDATVPSIASLDLANSLNDGQELFETFNKRKNFLLDSISNDIKAIEDYFNKVRIDEEYHFLRYESNWEYGPDARVGVEYLSWRMDSSSRFRIHFAFTDSQKTEWLPLIECKAAIRKTVYRDLPSFVNGLKAFLAERLTEEDLIEENSDIPF